MTLDEMLPLLERWRVTGRALDSVFTALRASVGSIPDSPLFQAAWAAHTFASDLLAERLGDAHTRLDWYQFENKWGARGHDAAVNGRWRPVRTVRDLAELIVESRPA